MCLERLCGLDESLLWKATLQIRARQSHKFERRRRKRDLVRKKRSSQSIDKGRKVSFPKRFVHLSKSSNGMKRGAWLSQTLEDQSHAYSRTGTFILHGILNRRSRSAELRRRTRDSALRIPLRIPLRNSPWVGPGATGATRARRGRSAARAPTRRGRAQSRASARRRTSSVPLGLLFFFAKPYPKIFPHLFPKTGRRARRGPKTGSRARPDRARRTAPKPRRLPVKKIERRPSLFPNELS